MVKLKAALSFGGILTKENIEDIISYFDVRELKAWMDFSIIGKVPNEIGFISPACHPYLCGHAPGRNKNCKYFREPNS